MNIFSSIQITPTRQLPDPSKNKYVQLLLNDYSPWAFDEERAASFKGRWRTDVFQVTTDTSIDLEIGLGNGYFFADYSSRNPQRCLVGIELKYKPLIQSIRRALRGHATNMRAVRFHAALLEQLFGVAELDNVFIYFPDPWPKKRSHKHRLVQRDFLTALYGLQKPGSYVEFKTDSLEYFTWVLEHARQTPYRISRCTEDLHHSAWAQGNFITHFERLWVSKGSKINYLRLDV